MNNGNHIDMLCRCHGQQKMAEVTQGCGIEVVSRHHGTYHVGSLSIRDLLVQLSGTTDGSAIIACVQEWVSA